MKLLSVILTLLCLCWGTSSKCLIRGECYELGGFVKPCSTDEDAPTLKSDTDPEEFDEIIQIIRNRCPSLTVHPNGTDMHDDEIVTCCDAAQLRKMSESLMLSDGVLGRCPVCARNFIRQICEMNCSPDQSRFIEVREEVGSNGEKFVNEIFYRVHEDFMERAHASCAGVIVPQTGVPAINLMCGNADVCDDEAWFGFTGDTSANPLAPVQVNFLKWPTTEDSMSAYAPLCNETLEGDFPCSCMDCLALCPVGNEPTVLEPCNVFGNINCIAFAVGLVFFVIVVTFFIILTLIEYRKARKEQHNAKKTSDKNFVVTMFQTIFSKIGEISAAHPIIMITLTSWVVFAMFFGFVRLNITSNPIELWSAPESRSRQELDYFNTRFGPFYRASQVFLRVKLNSFERNNITYGPAFRLEAIQELIKLEDAIFEIGRADNGVTLEEICFAPLRLPGEEKKLEQCVHMSVSVFFPSRHDINNDTYLTTIQNCLNNHLALNCMASWGGGSEPEITFGGYEGDNILEADTLLINFPISNFLSPSDLEPVMDWEARFLELLHDYEANNKSDFIEVSFAADRSIEDEIIRVSRAEAIPIAISYVLMFVYVTVALGNIRSCRTWLVDSKIMVAVSSILVVVASIFCSIGVMGYTQITLTLLAINVIPFFVLAVGIDNVFLMVNTLYDIDSNLKQFDDYNENFSFEKKRRFVFSKMMGRVGPSMFVSSITQITCFAIGSLANFPAVVTFSIFASISLGFLFIFQITTVTAIISLDYMRVSQRRLDVLCCVQKKILDDNDPLHSEIPRKGIATRFMEPYSRILLNWRTKIIVIIIFIAMTSASVMLIPMLEIGLDQEMALPKDSYVYRYLQAVNNLMRIGPPVYFVLKSGLNFTNIEHQNVICGGRMCNETSLAVQIFLAAQHRDVTYMARSSNSWIDDFIDWTNLPGSCCKYNTTDGSFCLSSSTESDCAFCSIDRDEWAGGMRPAPEAFDKYIPFFLRDPPTEMCNRGGLASYFNSVNYILDAEGNAIVQDTNFMAYHVSLSTSKDYITALKYGYEIADNITASIKQITGTDVEVFPYSVFYVFYEQYLSMWWDTFSSIGYCLIGALIFNLLASGFNFLTSFAVMFTVLLVVLNMMGVMYLWSIPLNAVSCVNLIVSIGIAVEFCSHLAYAYATSKEPTNERVKDALTKIGSTIITGITLTNIPVIVLAFSYTEIIEVFFFRMFFSLVILSFLHGMIFFPVLLCYLNNLFIK
nr:Niemann-Pick C1 protein b [Chilo suppressalis]